MKAFIIMADIISSSAHNGQELMGDFKKIVKDVNSRYNKEIISPLTITLGDEFQGVVSDLMAAVQIIFALDEKLLKNDNDFNLRYIVNYGEIDTEINKKIAHEMLGEGLTKARKGLEQMKSEDRETLIMGIEDSKLTKLNLALQLYRSIYNDWHKKDRQLVFDFLQMDDYKKLAEKYSKDPSSMWRKRRSLKIEDFKRSKTLIELIANES
ncbi:hypothetical protein E1176_16940 [Fulvivirga sp. RKSG066]|nr:hypothetical protein [Fulvivirga aurantia]